MYRNGKFVRFNFQKCIGKRVVELYFFRLFFFANFYASSRSTKMSGTSWSFDDLLKSRLSSAVIHGCSKMSSDKIRSSGSLRSSERIMHRAFDVKQSGTRNWPRDIFANSDACSESLNGYLQKIQNRNENIDIN